MLPSPGRLGPEWAQRATSAAGEKLPPVSKSDLALWLGIYASAVASATGLWSLFRELWLERARLSVIPRQAWIVQTTAGRPLMAQVEFIRFESGIARGWRILHAH
jgi:hypothetical protein